MSSKFKSTFLSILVVVTAALFLLAPVQPAQAQTFGQTGLGFAAVGPLDPVTGFPAFFVDTLGLSLGQCLDGAPNCLPLDGIDPTQPLAVPGNFPPEFFYFIASPVFADPGGNVTVVEYALEGGWGGVGVPAVGQQAVFQRIRYRLTGLTPPPGNLTIDHPWGTDIVPIDPDPQNPLLGEVNQTLDIPGLVAGQFEAARAATLFGPSLTAVTPAPPVGFIGTCGGSQTVTGGTVRNNITITGGGLNLTTTLWDICGKVFAPAPAPQTGATFNRNNLGDGTVDVTAIQVPAAAATVEVTGDVTTLPGEPLNGFALIQSAVDPTIWTVAILIAPADVLPDSVTITIDRGLVTEEIRPALPVTDKIVGDAASPVPIAVFNATDSILGVSAGSSNKRAPLPTLTVTDPAAVVLGTIPGAGGTLSVPMAAAPASVTITSTADPLAVDPAGGTVTIPVETIGAAPVPPGGGAVVGGGGGGGGCFITDLLGW